MSPDHQVRCRASLATVENDYLRQGAMKCANDLMEKYKTESDSKDSKDEDPKKTLTYSGGRFCGSIPLMIKPTLTDEELAAR